MDLKCWKQFQDTLPLNFPGGSDGKGSTYSVGDLGSIPELGRSPGEGNGNHSSILAWKIPWTEEPGGLSSMELQRVGHDWATELNWWLLYGLPKWLSDKESACHCRRHGFDPWIGKVPWRRKWQPLQYFYLENTMDRGAWWATVQRGHKRLRQDLVLNNNNTGCYIGTISIS